MIETDIGAEVATLARRHRQLGEVIADLTQQRADLAARFESLVPVGFETEVDGEPVYRKLPNRAWNEDAAIAVAQLHNIPVVLATVVDTADLKRRLKAAELLDDAMLPGDGKNRVKL